VRTRILAVAALLVAALAPAAAATPPRALPQASASIVGGAPAAIADWPSIAFVVAVFGQSAAACTGTVVAPSWVASAAHCAFRPDGRPVDGIVTLTGVADTRSPGEWIAADRVAVDPRWDHVRLTGDTLLIHLVRPSSRPAMPLAVAGGPYVAPPGVPNAAGWGTLDEGSTIGTTVLQEAYLAPHADCAVYATDFDPATQTCAGTLGTAGVCHGDSGGPLVRFRADTGAPVLWGLTSYGTQLELGYQRPCDLRAPAIFSWIPAFAGFIQRTVGPPPAAPTVGPPPLIQPPRDTVAPVIGRAKLSRRRIRVARRGATMAHRTGAMLSFVLSEPAAVTVTVLRQRGRRLKRLSPKVPLAASAGRVSRRFSGRLNGKALRRGRYRLRLDAVDAAGNAARPATVAFRIVRSGHSQRIDSGAGRIRSTRAGAPATTALSGTSLVTTVDVPITTLSPTVTPRRMHAP
jgi:hypothetical protein